MIGSFLMQPSPTSYPLIARIQLLIFPISPYSGKYQMGKTGFSYQFAEL